MKSIIINLISVFGSFASLIGLYIALDSGCSTVMGLNVNYLYYFNVFFSLLVAYFLFLDIYNYYKNCDIVYEGKNKNTKINNFMLNWIKDSGKIVIFSRDMTWAGQVDIFNVLSQKSIDREVVLIVSNTNHVVSSLKNNGAEVILYEETGYTPDVRFTIANLDRPDERIAVAHAEQNKHIIHRFYKGKCITFNMAKNLYKTVKMLVESHDKMMASQQKLQNVK